MGFRRGAYFAQYSMPSQLDLKDASGGRTPGATVMAVSMRKSFWLVPVRASRGMPRAFAFAKYMNLTVMLQMGWHVTREVLTLSMGMPSKRARMSSIVSMETPPLPASARASGSVES